MQVSLFVRYTKQFRLRSPRLVEKGKKKGKLEMQDQILCMYDFM